ncbi:MAG: hypothetical protein JXL84_24895, partial [Deltaproteobacteria bacterium]|nr:hypothetical protein [Deltaproteobacteria bacterium]
PDGEDVGGFAFPPAFGLIPGLEGPGVPSDLKSLPALAIPMAPGVESLNAALATGIVLYRWRSRIPKDPAQIVLDKGGDQGVRTIPLQGVSLVGRPFRAQGRTKTYITRKTRKSGSGTRTPN